MSDQGAEPFYVYIAHPLSDLPPQYLANVATVCLVARDLMKYGFTPINPAADLLEGIVGAEPLPLELYQERSLNLLRLLAGRRAALYVLGDRHADGRGSKGVAGEVAEAIRLGIPRAYLFRTLLELRAGGS